MTPTAWWQKRFNDGTIGVVARWEYPISSKVEVNDGSGWRYAAVFLDINEDPDWERSTQADVEAWLARAQNPS